MPYILEPALSLINRQKAEIERLTKEKYRVTEDAVKIIVSIETAKREAIKEFADEVLNAISFTPVRGSFDYSMGYEDALHKAIEIVKSTIKEVVGEDK